MRAKKQAVTSHQDWSFKGFRRVGGGDGFSADDRPSWCRQEGKGGRGRGRRAEEDGLQELEASTGLKSETENWRELDREEAAGQETVTHPRTKDPRQQSAFFQVILASFAGCNNGDRKDKFGFSLSLGTSRAWRKANYFFILLVLPSQPLPRAFLYNLASP